MLFCCLMQILIVEDDPAIATTLKFSLEKEGYQVVWVDTVAKVAPSLASLPRLDAVVLDVGLPDGDGFGVCQMIRLHATHRHVPILFLTARADEIDRILGLELGADDYMPKPFSPRELIARLKAIWRRDNFKPQSVQSQDTTGLPHADFVKTVGANVWHYTAHDYTLLLNDKPLTLSKTELAIMLTLLNNPTHILSREQILANISPHPEHRLSRTIDSHIKALRQKLAEICDDELIITHRGLGYGLT